MSTVTYVGQSQGDGTGFASASVATQPGDTVLAFLYIDRLLVAEGHRADASSIAVQGGPWEVLDAGRAGGAGSITRDSRHLGVIYRATATGSSVTGGWAYRPSDVAGVMGDYPGSSLLRLLVYRGVRDVRLDAVRLPAGATPAFPALYLPNATDGMVVRANIGKIAHYADGVHTPRIPGGGWDDSISRLRLADAPFPESRDVPSHTNAPGSSASDSWGWSISLAGRYAPAPPEIIEPAIGVNTTRDLSAGLTIQWLPAPEHGTQATYQLRKTTGATVEYWTGTAWSSTETTLTGTATSVTIPSLPNGGAVHEFAVRTSSTTRPDLSEWATTTVTGMAPPTVSQVRIFRWGSPDVTAGGTLATRTPYVDVNGDAAAGATLTGWRAVIRHGSTVLYDTGITNLWWKQVAVEEALPNNLTGVYVDGWVYQNGTQPSAKVTFGPFSVSVPTPAAPTLGTQSIEHPISGAPGVRLSLSWPAIGETGDGHVRVVRNGEEMLVPVTPTQTTLDLDDYYAPSNEPTTYVASVIDNKAPANEGPATTVTLPGPVVDTEWIVDALDPERAWPIILTEHEPGVRATRTTTWSPFTSSGHVVRPGVVADPIGSMTITTLDREDHAAVMDLLASGRELLLRTRLEPDGAGDYWPSGDLRFRVTSDLTVSRVVKGKAAAWRQVAFEWAAQ